MASQFISTCLYVLKSVRHFFRKQQEMDFQFAFKHLQLDLMTLPDLYFTKLSKKPPISNHGTFLYADMKMWMLACSYRWWGILLMSAPNTFQLPVAVH